LNEKQDVYKKPKLKQNFFDCLIYMEVTGNTKFVKTKNIPYNDVTELRQLTALDNF